ncbi:MAG: GNAT family N-acetyltransferase, partial [Rickettsiales bacterium]|nr:GNAT family N-acetyltransferase [Rickettsiales bacterium]
SLHRRTRKIMHYVTPADTDHIPLIQKLAHRIWPVAYRDILQPHHIANMLERIYSDENLQSEMQSGHRFYLIYAEDVPSGFASAYKDGEILWIKKIYVDTTRQRGGLGSALLEEAADDFAPVKEIRLLVNRENAPAMAFYEHKGFTRVGEKPVRMGDFDFIDYIYSKPIIYPCIS